jgi:5-methylcytosine-specific restriction endonuclease McrA
MISRIYEWTKARKVVLPQLIERDGLTCHYCGIDLVPPDARYDQAPYYCIDEWRTSLSRYTQYKVSPQYGRLSVDHIIPMSQGGADTMDNLVICCHKCNSGKCNMSYDEYMARKHTYRLARIAQGDD